MKQTLFIIVFTLFLGLPFSQANDSINNDSTAVETQTEQADGLRIDPVNPQQASHVHCMCYPWVWSWNTWWHHHVYWNGCGWIHTYARADYVYHGFFNRYVWMCSWPGCGAIRF